MLAGLLASAFLLSAHAEKPLALVYKGPGVCPQTAETTGCSEAARAAAESAGFEVVYVGAKMPDAVLFSRAKVWIQPGGKASVEQKVMAAELKSAIKDFVKGGGGYVGFCAGGFLAMDAFGWEEDDGSQYSASGFGLLRGKGFYYDQFPGVTDDDPARMAFTLWDGQKRYLYWELGPYFTKDTVALSRATVVAYYYRPPAFMWADPDRVMTLRGEFGKGRVYVTAVHPEAPADWSRGYGLKDIDGPDLSLAVEMIRWAARLSGQ